VSDRINKDDLIKRVAVETGLDKIIVTEIVDTIFEEIYQAFKREEKVTIRKFGTFYIDVRRSGTVFKFNPAQRLRALFG
jgi:DNA-binding protein HU-beta